MYMFLYIMFMFLYMYKYTCMYIQDLEFGKMLWLWGTLRHSESKISFYCENVFFLRGEALGAIGQVFPYEPLNYTRTVYMHMSKTNMHTTSYYTLYSSFTCTVCTKHVHVQGYHSMQHALVLTSESLSSRPMDWTVFMMCCTSGLSLSQIRLIHTVRRGEGKGGKRKGRRGKVERKEHKGKCSKQAQCTCYMYACTICICAVCVHLHVHAQCTAHVCTWLNDGDTINKARQHNTTTWDGSLFLLFEEKVSCPRWDSNPHHCFSRPVLYH